MVIGKYDEGNQAGVSRKAVEVIRDYLDSVNLWEVLVIIVLKCH